MSIDDPETESSWLGEKGIKQFLINKFGDTAQQVQQIFDDIAHTGHNGHKIDHPDLYLLKRYDELRDFYLAPLPKPFNRKAYLFDEDTPKDVIVGILATVPGYHNDTEKKISSPEVEVSGGIKGMVDQQELIFDSVAYNARMKVLREQKEFLLNDIT